MKTIQRIAATTAILAGLVGIGCSGNGQEPFRETGRASNVPEIVSENPGKFQRDRSGYWVEKYFADSHLTANAGILAGTVSVKRTPDGYISEGSYSRMRNPLDYEAAARLADVNGDMVVTSQEAMNSTKIISERFAQ